MRSACKVIRHFNFEFLVVQRAMLPDAASKEVLRRGVQSRYVEDEGRGVARHLRGPGKVTGLIMRLRGHDENCVRTRVC